MDSVNDPRTRARHDAVLFALLEVIVRIACYLGSTVALSRLADLIGEDSPVFYLLFPAVVGHIYMYIDDTPSSALKEWRVPATFGHHSLGAGARVLLSVNWERRIEEVAVTRGEGNSSGTTEFPTQPAPYLAPSVLLYLVVRIIFLLGVIEIIKMVGEAMGGWMLFSLVSNDVLQLFNTKEPWCSVLEAVREVFKPHMPYARLRVQLSVAREAAQEGLIAGESSSDGHGGQTVAVEETAAAWR